MILLILIPGYLNPELSFSVLLTDNNTDDYFNSIYQFEIENDFVKKDFGGGIYLDYFFKESYPLENKYFIRSGLPFKINALAGGLQLKYSAFRYAEFFINLGYSMGWISHPVAGDSGRVIEDSDFRKSPGFGMGVNVFHKFGNILAGAKFYTNLISFSAKKPSYYWYYEIYEPSIDYISLNGAGFGIFLGWAKGWGK